MGARGQYLKSPLLHPAANLHELFWLWDAVQFARGAPSRQAPEKMRSSVIIAMRITGGGQDHVRL
jgi:hypothetical protein